LGANNDRPALSLLNAHTKGAGKPAQHSLMEWIPAFAEITVLDWKASTITRGRGRPRVSVKRPTLNMRVDAEVLEAFKATGAGWQTRINAVLRDAVAHGVTKVP